MNFSSNCWNIKFRGTNVVKLSLLDLGGQSDQGSLNFSHIFARKIPTDSTNILLEYFQLQIQIYHFPVQITNYKRISSFVFILVYTWKLCLS